MSGKKVSEMTSQEEQRAAQLYERAIVIEGLTYAPILSNPGYIEEIRKAGVTGNHITVTATDAGPREAFSTISGWYILAEKTGCRFALSAQDIVQAKKDGKVCVIMGSQNARMLDDDLNLIRIFHRLGIRIIQLAYAEQNFIGSAGEDPDAGISRFGRKAIEEMNRLGILVDVSHCGDQTVMDAIRYSEKPVAITHANPRALINHQRNKTDEQIRALAEKGGVLGLNSWAPIAGRVKGVRPKLEDFLDMIDYVVKVAGPDHVAFGLDLTPNWEYDRSDYERWARLYPNLAPPSFEERLTEGVTQISEVKNIARGLVARGYKDEDILKILGGNLLELFHKVWS